MTAAPVAHPRGYIVQLGSFAWGSVARVVRAPSHSRRAEARRAQARHWLAVSAVTAAVIAVLMFAIDVAVISNMPDRGAANLWPIRIFTDFGKSTYVLWALALALLVILAVLPRLSSLSRPVLIAFGIRVQYIFLSVLFAVLVSEVLKYIIGRSRPFVGGVANAFYYSHFSGNPAFESLPSGHATTSFALAFAVASLWRNAAAAMWTFAVLICVSRVVLLAHHPSDVVAGALTGIIGAMVVRYWFASRRLAFSIGRDGTIAPLPGPSWTALKRVAREAFAP